MQRRANLPLTRLVVGILGMLIATAAQPQSAAPTAEAPALIIKGTVRQELHLTLAEVKAMPRVKMSAQGHDGAMHQYQGATLQSLLAKAGVPTGSELRGKNMTLYVVAEASDNYRVVFSLAEMDGDFGTEAVLVADTAEGKPLGSDQGPLRLIVPGDKRQGRWVRTLKSITIASAP
jgi:DMSO/TMAO reductase YedYZ molybdopterin-dependent catalytic subunit